MKISDINIQKGINFSFETGEVFFKDQKLIIFDANAFGLLKQCVIESLGMEGARRFFLRFGFKQGYSDYLQTKVNFEYEDENEILINGPVLHSWNGLSKTIPKSFDVDKEKGVFIFSGRSTNTIEAEQYLTYYDKSTEPVCWMLMGYSSGWCSAFFGSKLISIEKKCIGMGDDFCEWEIKPPEIWDYNLAKTYIEALEGL